MPKDTFMNLGEEKKQKIFDAAVEEFSKKRFSEASINQIVKGAGIPRGSFYQYFADKEDIFLMMYHRILEEKTRVILSQLPPTPPEMDTFEACLLAIRLSLDWSWANPEYARISMLMEVDDSAFIARLREESALPLRQRVERDQRRGLMKPDLEPGVIVEMINSLIIKEYHWVGLDGELFIQRVEQILRILREGVKT